MEVDTLSIAPQRANNNICRRAAVSIMFRLATKGPGLSLARIENVFFPGQGNYSAVDQCILESRPRKRRKDKEMPERHRHTTASKCGRTAAS
jgi:hypothetical protein